MSTLSTSPSAEPEFAMVIVPLVTAVPFLRTVMVASALVIALAMQVETWMT